jgi:hypothetical protein
MLTILWHHIHSDEYICVMTVWNTKQILHSIYFKINLKHDTICFLLYKVFHSDVWKLSEFSYHKVVNWK